MMPQRLDVHHDAEAAAAAQAAFAEGGHHVHPAPVAVRLGGTDRIHGGDALEGLVHHVPFHQALGLIGDVLEQAAAALAEMGAARLRPFTAVAFGKLFDVKSLFFFH